MAAHPEVLWAQRSSETDEAKNIIYLTVNVPEINESTLKIDIKEKQINFEAKAGRPKELDYKFNIDLYGEIVPEKTRKSLTTRSLVLILQKKEKKLEFWPRLTAEKIRTPFIKTDFNKWVDEDEQDGDAAALDDDLDMGGMGGMGDMGGLGGMGGMGGLGGMGGMGGGPDLQELMSKIQAGGAGGGPSDLGADGSDDEDDDDGPPPLEETEPIASGSS